jgi:hypothetical protein
MKTGNPLHSFILYTLRPCLRGGHVGSREHRIDAVLITIGFWILNSETRFEREKLKLHQGNSPYILTSCVKIKAIVCSVKETLFWRCCWFLALPLSFSTLTQLHQIAAKYAILSYGCYPPLKLEDAPMEIPSDSNCAWLRVYSPSR